MPGLGVRLGRGAATTFQMDLQNADCILIEGSNFAECHPVGFRWVMKAKERGATMDNEWNHVQQKLMRGLGIVAIENQARI